MSLASKLANLGSLLISVNYGKFLSLDSNGNAQATTLPAVSGMFRNLRGSSTGTSALMTYSVDEIVLGDGNGNYLNVRSLSGSINTATNGVNGLDTGSVAANTWYYSFAIAKADGTKGLLASLSATAPTLPSGYTFFARIGSFLTDNVGTKYPFTYLQYGRSIAYLPTAGSNLTQYMQLFSGTITGQNISVLAYVPPTAIFINTHLFASPGSSSTTTGTVSTNGTSATGNYIFASTPASTSAFSSSCSIPITSSNTVYVSGTAGSGTIYASVHGWEDSF